MTPEWPEESPEYLAREAAIGQNGNNGDHYDDDLIAPHEDEEVRLVMGGHKPLGTIERLKNELGFALAISLGGAGMLCTKILYTEGAAEVAFVKPGCSHVLGLYQELLETGVQDYGIKEYHRRMGKLYGYSEASIEEFINAEIDCNCHKCKGK